MQLCPVQHECGACQTLDIPYADQLVAKERYIQELFANVADGSCIFHPILGMENPSEYRTKIISPFAPGRKKRAQRAKGSRGSHKSHTSRGLGYEVLCGMYAGHSHRIIPAKQCRIEHPIGRKVVYAVKTLMERHGVEPYDEDALTGFIRAVVVRVGYASGEVLVTLVTNGRDFPSSKQFARGLVKLVPDITTVVQNVNTRDTNAVLGSQERVLYGPGFILDTLCGLSFRISSRSFYQVNVGQTEVLYRRAMEMAGITDKHQPLSIVDAYCGTGTIGLVAASYGNAEVTGVDSVSSAIRDARMNAKHNGITNAGFVAEDATSYMVKRAQTGDSCGVLFMDPPRSGSTPEFLRAVCELSPVKIVYISCNPETQARDVRLLRAYGYQINEIQPVDMFPHTHHVENVALLSKVK